MSCNDKPMRVSLVYLSELFATFRVFSSPVVMAGGSLYGGWGMLLHPTASLLAAYRFQPLKKALYPNKEAKSTLYSNKEPFLRKTRKRQGREPLNPYLLAVLLLQRDCRYFLTPGVQFLNGRL